MYFSLLLDIYICTYIYIYKHLDVCELYLKHWQLSNIITEVKLIKFNSLSL